MKISVQTLDRKIWNKPGLVAALYQSLIKKEPIEISFLPEGSCAESLGLYSLLDEFCDKNSYDKSQVTIHTANMIEQHDRYRIVHHGGYWYEIADIQKWLQDKTMTFTVDPIKHFGNFISRSNWARLWIATMLDSFYRDQTLQTYHYDPIRKNYNGNGYIGIDELAFRKCDLVVEAAKFISTCPRTLDIDYLRSFDYSNTIYQHESSYYPIQHPVNLNLLQYYHDIFVDVVVEANVSGKNFLCTEKTWRPMVARRPFVIMSSREFLVNLRRLGFRTFDKWWDEGYDYLEHELRIQEIRKLLDNIARWPQQKLKQTLIEMQPVLDHNLEVFTSLTAAKVEEVFR